MKEEVILDYGREYWWDDGRLGWVEELKVSDGDYEGLKKVVK